MKKLLNVSVASLVAACLFLSCTKKESAKTSESEKKTEVAVEKTDEGKITKDNIKVGFVYIGSIHDEGYTASHDRGRLALEEMGINCAYIEDVPENADCEKAIRDLIDQGCNVIYTTSFNFMDWTIKVAKEFPNVKFGHCSGYKRADNVSTYFGRMYEARYLAGIVAGLKTKTNKIGSVAAFPIPECIRAINAFTLGVQSVNPDATVDVLWTNTWYDPATEKSVALEVLNRGCDVIEQHQDTTAAQIAAQEKGAFSIGYNLPTPNAAPKSYLTAPIFHWDVFIKDDVQRILDGTWESRSYWEGLTSGIVDLDKLSALCESGTQEKVDAARAAIEDGSLKVFTGPLYDNEGVERVKEGEVMSDDDIWNMKWFVKGINGVIPQN